MNKAVKPLKISIVKVIAMAISLMFYLIKFIYIGSIVK